MHEISLALMGQVANFRTYWPSNITAQFTLGISIGILVGFFALSGNYADEISTTPISISNIDQPIEKFTTISENISILDDIHIQCIIFINPKQEYKRKHVETLRDTYTKQCNHTVYVTNSQRICSEFSGTIIHYFCHRYHYYDFLCNCLLLLSFVIDYLI